MGDSIDLDDQFAFYRNEVDYIPTDRMLPPKFSASESATA